MWYHLCLQTHWGFHEISSGLVSKLCEGSKLPAALLSFTPQAEWLEALLSWVLEWVLETLCHCHSEAALFVLCARQGRGMRMGWVGAVTVNEV